MTVVLVEAVKPNELKPDQNPDLDHFCHYLRAASQKHPSRVISGFTPLLHHQNGYLVCVGAPHPENKQLSSTFSFKLKSSLNLAFFPSSNPRSQKSQRLKIPNTNSQIQDYPSTRINYQQDDLHPQQASRQSHHQQLLRQHPLGDHRACQE